MHDGSRCTLSTVHVGWALGVIIDGSRCMQCWTCSRLSVASVLSLYPAPWSPREALRDTDQQSSGVSGVSANPAAAGGAEEAAVERPAGMLRIRLRAGR